MSEKISRLPSDTALNFSAGIDTFVFHVNVSAPFHAGCFDSESPPVCELSSDEEEFPALELLPDGELSSGVEGLS
ncbi:MAG: hypothetical protein K2H73_10155, partial [Treponemataceae bacterium]|nr:hypothetical protein [Treponemataceae bacterium]